MYKGYSSILGKWIVGELIITNFNYFIFSGIEYYIVEKDSVTKL